MAKVEYLHICDHAFVAEGGKPCIIGIFDRITASAFPFVHPSMSIAIQFRGAPHEVIPIKIELSRPNAEVIATLEGQVPVGDGGGAFLHFNLINTQFPEAGCYSVTVSSSAKTLASHALALLKGQHPLQSAPPVAESKKFH